MSPLTDLVAQLPWVTRLDETQDCISYRWGHMPLKALGDSFLMSRYKCRARARWRFEPLPDPFLPGLAPEPGIYCWAHLHTQFHRNLAEESRYEEEIARLGGQLLVYSARQEISRNEDWLQEAQRTGDDIDPPRPWPRARRD